MEDVVVFFTQLIDRIKQICIGPYKKSVSMLIAIIISIVIMRADILRYTFAYHKFCAEHF